MRIGINAYEANVSNRVGSNQYAYRVLVELEKLLREDDVTVFLPSAPLPDMPKPRLGWKYRVLRPSLLWTLWRLPLDLFLGSAMGRQYDVFYSLGHYAPRFSPCPSVISIMDLAFLSFPEFFNKRDVFKLKRWTDYSARKATCIITISENSKQDIVKRYGIAPTRIAVASPGFDQSALIGSPKRILQKLDVKEPYIAYIGTIQPRKNLVRLVKAFELVAQKSKQKHLQLVLVGKIGWLADEVIKTVQHSPVHARIKLLGFVSEEEKLTLYNYSLASVLVGLYEGFGIPPLEAMAAGTVPIVSNTASLPEVVSDAGILVDPYSIEDIARGIQEVLEYTARRRTEMIQKGTRQLQKFSWEETGKHIRDVLYAVGGTP